ncbi:hypothetical protein RRG08_024587 [Elysia crispata]|uniref:Uncharacterized protein n=1 Tax=Elysia crispata TaxID=231223 RepID=A0AAE0ZWF0_9GAST|nr:hypothetical protein RRG08_024587 [Elysia crispata]
MPCARPAWALFACFFSPLRRRGRGELDETTTATTLPSSRDGYHSYKSYHNYHYHHYPYTMMLAPPTLRLVPGVFLVYPHSDRINSFDKEDYTGHLNRITGQCPIGVQLSL